MDTTQDEFGASDSVETTDDGAQAGDTSVDTSDIPDKYLQEDGSVDISALNKARDHLERKLGNWQEVEAKAQWADQVLPMREEINNFLSNRGNGQQAEQTGASNGGQVDKEEFLRKFAEDPQGTLAGMLSSAMQPQIDQIQRDNQMRQAENDRDKAYLNLRTKHPEFKEQEPDFQKFVSERTYTYDDLYDLYQAKAERDSLKGRIGEIQKSNRDNAGLFAGSPAVPNSTPKQEKPAAGDFKLAVQNAVDALKRGDSF